MRLEGWRKRRRDEATREGDGEREHVDLESGEHAWWAARDDVQSVPRGTQGSSRRRGARPANGSAPADASHTVFQQYFTRESLFDEPPAIDISAGPDDPYRVLGIPHTASWDEVTAAHRRLAKEHHPDRLAAATPQQRAISERYMRDANIAYMELRQRRAR